MTSFWRENQLVPTIKKNLKDSSWFGEPKCKFGSNIARFFVLFHCFLLTCCSNSMKMKDMLWIEDIVESTSTSPFLTNSRVDMVGFVDLHKVVARRSAFSAFPSAWNGVESEGGAKNEGLKCQFSQVEGALDLQEILKLVPNPNKSTKEESNCGERQR